MGRLQEVLLVLGGGGPLGTRDSLSDDASGNRVRTEAELPQPGVTQTLGGAGPIPEESHTSGGLIHAITPVIPLKKSFDKNDLR